MPTRGAPDAMRLAFLVLLLALPLASADDPVEVSGACLSVDYHDGEVTTRLGVEGSAAGIPLACQADRLHLAPSVFASAGDTFATLLYGPGEASVKAPDGAMLTVSTTLPNLLFVRLGLDGAVLSVTDLGHYFVTCDAMPADSVQVTGNLAGAAADGTWTVGGSAGGDFVLSVQGKAIAGVYDDPSSFGPGGCPDTNAWRPVHQTTWNWHCSEGVHRSEFGNTLLTPEESPAFARYFVAR